MKLTCEWLQIKCQPKKDMICGPEVETVSKNSVEAGPGECPFELRHSFTRERAAGDWYKQLGYFCLKMLQV